MCCVGLCFCGCKGDFMDIFIEVVGVVLVKGRVVVLFGCVLDEVNEYLVGSVYYVVWLVGYMGLMCIYGGEGVGVLY